MTSIFGDLYLENLERVNSRSSEQRARKAGDKGEEKFIEVLADVEQKNNKNRQVNVQTSTTNRANKQIAAADEHARARLSNTPLPPQVFIDEIAPKIESGVKTSDEAVKHTAPRPVLPGVYSSPDAPVVVASGRLVNEAPRRTAGKEEPLPPYALEEIKDIIVTAGRYHGVDPLLGLAVAKVESSYQHDAVSSDGHRSKGVFQLLDSTANHMMNVSGVNERYDPFDPGMNAFLGLGYLRRLMEMFSSRTRLAGERHTVPAKTSQELEKLAVAAFNAGEGSVARAQAKAKATGKNPALFSSIQPYLPESTREYVARVARVKQALRKADSGAETA